MSEVQNMMKARIISGLDRAGALEVYDILEKNGQMTLKELEVELTNPTDGMPDERNLVSLLRKMMRKGGILSLSGKGRAMKIKLLKKIEIKIEDIK